MKQSKVKLDADIESNRDLETKLRLNADDKEYLVKQYKSKYGESEATCSGHNEVNQMCTDCKVCNPL